MSSPSSNGALALSSEIWVRLRDLLELTKARLSTLVLATVAFGYFMAPAGDAGIMTLVVALVGIGLVAAGSSALNQYIERDLDLRMDRTKNRPLPSGRMDPIEALGFGVISALAGTLILAIGVNVLVAVLAASSFVIYVFAYTPLKVEHSFHTLIGAISGALPPVMGWAARSDDLSMGAWFLFAILFIWQLPHFFAIAWIYREDYGRAGMKMLTVGDSDGRLTTKQILLFSLTLIPVSLMPVFAGLTGWLYVVLAVGFGLIFFALSVRLFRRRTHHQARVLYLSSLVYLPCLLGAMLIDKGIS